MAVIASSSTDSTREGIHKHMVFSLLDHEAMTACVAMALFVKFD
ncbi:hypothetical protein ACBZ90_18545 (plasmid) [Vibrio alginolyticus]